MKPEADPVETKASTPDVSCPANGRKSPESRNSTSGSEAVILSAAPITGHFSNAQKGWSAL